MRQYHGYFFDFYGTLAEIHTDETKPAFWKAVAAFYSENGAVYKAEALRERYLSLCAGEEARLQRLHPGSAVEPELLNVFRALYTEKGIDAGPALLTETARCFRRRSTTHLRAYAGAAELLQALRAAGKTVVLLSNAQACFTLRELEQLGLKQCFDQIWISSQAGFRKPDPAFFRMPLQALDLDPADCLMIGNDPLCDLQGAAAVGMDALYIHSALSPRGNPAPNDAVLCLPRMDLRALRRKLMPRG